jgi:hypothetical protein
LGLDDRYPLTAAAPAPSDEAPVPIPHDRPLPIPAVFCPLPAAVNGRHEELESQTVAWLRTFALFASEDQHSRLTHTAVGELVARVSPDGQSPALQIVADFYMWLFAFDDAYCDESSLGLKPGPMAVELARVLRVAEAPQHPVPGDNAYAVALRDIRKRLESVATAVQLTRWVEAMRGYFYFQVWEAANRSQGVAPSLNDYAFARLQSGAVKVTMMLLDVADGYELPPAEMEKASTRAMVEMACAVIDWDNDIASHHKENARCPDGQNLRDIISREYGLAPEQALERAVAMRDRVMRRFLNLREQVLPTASPQLDRFIASLCHWIRGNLDWQATTMRYGHASAITGRAQFASHPSDDSALPLPMETIAWWWDEFPN